MTTTIIKNLFLPLLIVLVLYAIPVVPTWRTLKRKKVSFGAFLGWIAGEVLAIHIFLSLFSFATPNLQYYLNIKYKFDVGEAFMLGVFLSVIIFPFFPFVLKFLHFKKENIRKTILYTLGALLFSFMEFIAIMYLVAYGASQIKNF